MVMRWRLVVASFAVAAPLASIALFIGPFLYGVLPPLPYEVLLFSYWGLQFMLLLIAPTAAALAILLRRRALEGGRQLIAVRFVMPVVGLFLWLLVGTSVVISMPGA